MFGRIVLVLIDAHDNRYVFVFRRSGDDDLLDGVAQVALCLIGVSEAAGGFHYHLGAYRSPVQFGRVLLGEDTNFAAVDGDGIGFTRDLVPLEIADHRIVLQQVRQRLGVGQVVDRHEFQILVLERGPQNIAADAPKAVDAYLDCHTFS
jgi:hypothetical protein